jgi:predicted enzyme related to lactoylglutathione lyase
MDWRHLMNRIYSREVAIAALLLVTSAAHAQVSLNSVRIAAKDSVAVAKFYQAAFGLQETSRLQASGGPEIFMNFGATVEEAKAAKNAPILVMHRDSDDLKDPVPHVIFNVKDMAKTAAAIKAAGGSMAGEPRPFKSGGGAIGFALDPAGNRIELIQRP